MWSDCSVCLVNVLNVECDSWGYESRDSQRGNVLSIYESCKTFIVSNGPPSHGAV